MPRMFLQSLYTAINGWMNVGKQHGLLLVMPHIGAGELRLPTIGDRSRWLSDRYESLDN